MGIYMVICKVIVGRVETYKKVHHDLLYPSFVAFDVLHLNGTNTPSKITPPNPNCLLHIYH